MRTRRNIPAQTGKGWTGRVVSITTMVLALASFAVEGDIPIAAPRGVFVGTPVQKVALAGETAPGTGATFTDFDEPMVNSAGQVAFLANYSGGGGVFIGTGGGTPSKIFVSGDTVTGIGAVTVASEGQIDGPAISNNGTVAFAVRGTTDALVQKTTLGTPTALVKAGDAAPGTTNGVFTTFDDISQNHNDDVAFIAEYTEDGGTTFKSGVWLKPFGGALVKIIANGDPVPAGAITCPAGLVSDGTSDIDGPWVNDSQTVAFRIDGPCGNDSSGLDNVLVSQGGVLSTFVAEGDVAPAFLGGGTLGGITIGRPALNNSNTLVFRTNGGDDVPAYVTKTITGTFNLCLKDLTPAPGTVVNFDGLAENAAINATGDVFVQADVNNDPVVSAGIYSCRNGTVRKIAAEGDPMPGTTVFFSSNIEEGSIADGGLVTFLSEGGTFVQQVPVPTLSTWALIFLALLVGATVAWHLRRNKRVGVRLR